MKKVKKAAKKKSTNSLQSTEKIVRTGEGQFNFPNGDSYDGGYIIVNNQEIYRHGYGIYKTSNLDEYRAFWNKDEIASNLRIIYDNKAEYKGELDEVGAMNGKGTYVFPDGSAINATWKNNVPDSDFTYEDPLGYKWQGKESLNKEIIFIPENYVWRKDYD